MLDKGQHIYVTHSLRGATVTYFFHGLAEVYLFAAQQSTPTERARWLKKAKQSCRYALRRGQIARWGLSEAMRFQGTYEWLRARPAAALKWWQRSLAVAEEQGTRYELGMTCLEIGKRMQDRSYLVRSEQIFAEIGANLDLARVQEFLERKEIS